jgi:predicted alpha-1,2-mannosidase
MPCPLSRALLGAGVGVLFLAAPPALAERLIDLVQPIIGTARKDQTIGAVNSGQTYPAVGVPFGMTHFSPQTQATEDKCVSPYYFQDTRVSGFRGTHWWSGSCTHDYGSVTVAAGMGPVVVDPATRSATVDRGSEVLSPAYYRIDLVEPGVRAELTGSARSGVLRFTFTRPGEAYVLVETAYKKDERKPDGRVAVGLPQGGGPITIEGSNPVRRLYAGKGQPAGFAGHFAATLRRQDGQALRVLGHGSFAGGKIRPGVSEARGDAGVPGAFVRLQVAAGDVVLVQLGTSFVSVDEARRNLVVEIAGAAFDEIRARAEATWEQLLGRARVTGGSTEQRTLFYTALYHALLMPRLMSDASGTYPSFAGGATPSRVRRAEGWDYYDDFSLWDTFRAVHPLLILVAPERVPSMVRSMLAKAEQGGWLPNFPGWNSYTSAMVGDHGASMIADAYVKGVRAFDAQAALAAMKKNANEVPPREEYEDGRGRRALAEYLKLGYIPLEQEVKEAFHKREQVSRTLEYAYDDFAIAALASALGRRDDARVFGARAGNWRHVIDARVGFARGRHADGRFVEPFEPEVDAAREQPYITEGTPWQYTFFVPQDVPGLISVLGGRAAFVKKLDRFFAERRYWHGNEPSHHIAYLYTHAGAPWRTQEEVRRILAEEYALGPTGIKGNDDTGQLSAWYVLSSLGLYPVCPGTTTYELGAPLFEEARIDVGGGKIFTLRAPGASEANRYVQRGRLDGKPWTRPWIDHAALARGATLTLEMGPSPNKAWGASPKDAPPRALAPRLVPSGRGP